MLFMRGLIQEGTLLRVGLNQENTVYIKINIKIVLTGEKQENTVYLRQKVAV